jgi:UDP-N-acetylglucosamine diphosphorylase/glucosamine-1-phosphate N-acetyltransferase
MQVVIFEDNYYQLLFPISLLRPVYEIKIGFFTIAELIKSLLGPKYSPIFHCRELLRPYQTQTTDHILNSLLKDDYLLLNGRYVFNYKFIKWILSNLPDNSFLSYNDFIIAAKIGRKKISLLSSIKNVFEKNNFTQLKEISALKCEFFNYDDLLSTPWQVLNYFDGMFARHVDEFASRKKTKFKKLSDVNIINSKKVWISSEAKIYPFVVLDASSGSVIIEDGVILEPFSYIKGPVFIDKHTLIKSGTKIYGPFYAGIESRIAGEVSSSIFHSYVNKQHDGFVGNSYICPFVNFGADTVTSNLKNNYSSIKVKIKNEIFNSNRQFLGSIVGDHSKFGINTMLNTGTIVGIFANFAGYGFAPKFIDSFSWLVNNTPPARYEIEEALRTAKIVMKRRNIEMSAEYESLVRNLYKREHLDI